MLLETIDLLPAGPGTSHRLQVLHFGPTGGAGAADTPRPSATIQAALHADEVPALLVAHALRRRLAALEADGALAGPVRLLPYANPLGLSQQLLGQHQGRFDLADGRNYNRHHADLTEAAAARLVGTLGDDAAANVRQVRAALAAAAAELPAANPAEDLKRRLLQQALASDVVLDLHCDGAAVMHLYALTPHEALAHELGALLGAQAVLLADESGDSPFDEACSRPWLLLQQRFPQHPIPLACFATTVELRGAGDTAHALAERDADAIVEFLRRRGIVTGPAAPLPAPRCEPTPLAGSEPIVAPRAGVVVFRHEPGARLAAGSVVADLVDPASGEVEPLVCQTAGLLYARSASHWAAPGQRLAKIAGREARRSGKLLSP